MLAYELPPAEFSPAVLGQVLGARPSSPGGKAEGGGEEADRYHSHALKK